MNTADRLLAAFRRAAKTPPGAGAYRLHRAGYGSVCFTSPEDADLSLNVSFDGTRNFWARFYASDSTGRELELRAADQTLPAVTETIRRAFDAVFGCSLSVDYAHKALAFLTACRKQLEDGWGETVKAANEADRFRYLVNGVALVEGPKILASFQVFQLVFDGDVVAVYNHGSSAEAKVFTASADHRAILETGRGEPHYDEVRAAVDKLLEDDDQ